MKTTSDMTCKTENLKLTFAKIHLSVKDYNKKLNRRIARTLVESQLQPKHREKKQLKKELTILNNQLKSCLNIILCNILIHQVNFSVRLRQSKKWIKFRKSQEKYNESTTQSELIRNIVHIFSSYAPYQENLTPCRMD